eukprot:gene25907-19798_t
MHLCNPETCTHMVPVRFKRSKTALYPPCKCWVEDTLRDGGKLRALADCLARLVLRENARAAHGMATAAIAGMANIHTSRAMRRGVHEVAHALAVDANTCPYSALALAATPTPP